jgi:hypothetical protein
MNDLNESLGLLYSLLTKTGSNLPGLLEQGINNTSIDRILEKIRFPYKLPAPVYDLYQWKNGTSISDDKSLGELWLFPMGTFLSFQIAVDRYMSLACKDEYWKPFMFPLFQSGGGDYFLIDCDNRAN